MSMKYLIICTVLSLVDGVCLGNSEISSEAVFTHIYENGIWGGKWFSGGGSMVGSSAPYVAILKHYLKKYQIKSVADIGCGDWQFSRYIDWTGIEYIGYDVVQYIVEVNQKQFGANNIIFKRGDLITDDIPGADLLLCKEVLQHLTNADVHQFIHHCLPKFHYALIVNQVNPEDKSSNNPDNPRGGTRAIDLTKAPFFVKGEILLIYESEPNIFKQVLWVENEKYKN